MGLLNRINTTQNAEDSKFGSRPEAAMSGSDDKSKKRPAPSGVKERELKNKIQRKILEQFGNTQDINMVVSKIEPIAHEIAKKEPEKYRFINVPKVVQELINDVTGYGPINPLLLDSDVTEVMVNGPDMVYVEKKGKIQLTDIKFTDDDQVMQVIEKIVSPLGRRIDESSPMVDARLPDGSRVNAIIPPLSLIGPVITIRKFAREPYTIDDLINMKTLSREMAIFLNACVKARLNIFISGGTGSGKTTTLNVLSSFIPNDERIVTIEDAAELQLNQEHVISLESRPANIEGKGAIPIRELVVNALRMRPDRIIVGECRGGEALDMLQAMNTGHDGSLATGHANSPRDMLARLETMVLMAGVELPVKAIRQQIVGALDLIVQQARFKDGTRRITNITEVQNMEGDVVVLQDIFTFEHRGVDESGKIMGDLIATGIRPKFYDKFQTYGLNVPSSIFNVERW
ncbi:MAG: CpaF family protein [Solirubrobacterales bacterium]